MLALRGLFQPFPFPSATLYNRRWLYFCLATVLSVRKDVNEDADQQITSALEHIPAYIQLIFIYKSVVPTLTNLVKSNTNYWTLRKGKVVVGPPY
jgi:hypothetical protein